VIQSPVLINPAYPEHQLAPNSDTTNTEGLVIDDCWCEQQFLRHREWIGALDANPQPLLDWLTPRYNPRLGYYFESLVEFWLRHTKASESVVAHLAVRNEQRTVGEFDFLWLDSARQIIRHWEVAVKFYVHYQKGDGRVLWYGPNPQDRLDIKLQRLLGHQLLLSQRSEAQAALRQAGLLLPVVPSLFLKGYLFYPSHSHWREPPQDSALSPNHLRGWWTYLDVFDIPNAHEDRRWLFLPRLRWLAPAICAEPEQALMSFNELHSFCLDLLRRKQRPPLIAEMCFRNSYWQEVSRGFVLPQHWPQLEKQ